ncbi:MAG TPA: nitroreductase family protein, partial [Kouleothrix sp.]|nr:nitroreductase family protein [Kouleothrix sp.]
MSLPLAALPAAADPAMLHVRRRGQEIAVQISTGAIQFVAAAGEGPYTRAASYTVGEEATPGARALLTAAARVPDHGKLEPWRFVVLAGASKERFAAAIHERFPGKLLAY